MLYGDRRLHAAGTKSSEGDATSSKRGWKQDNGHHFEGLTVAQRFIQTPQCDMAQTNLDAIEQIHSGCNVTIYIVRVHFRHKYIKHSNYIYKMMEQRKSFWITFFYRNQTCEKIKKCFL